MDDECPICLETLNINPEKLYISPCKHIFHDICVQRLLGAGIQQCPVCRTKWKCEPIPIVQIVQVVQVVQLVPVGHTPWMCSCF